MAAAAPVAAEAAAAAAAAGAIVHLCVWDAEWGAKHYHAKILNVY